ncbi:MAG: hypothetical protein KDE22_09790 [Rhodobacterales bacterium]|nr:hypothetical protein [Rhodobacterales bacterium]
MSNGLVTPKAGAGGQVSIIPNINVTNRALPARVERSVLNATFQLDARQTTKFPGDAQLMKLSIVKKDIDISDGEVAVLVIRHYAHRLYDQGGAPIKPTFRNDTQANYDFPMDGRAAVNLFLEVDSLPASPRPEAHGTFLRLDLYAVHPALSPTITAVENDVSFARARADVQVSPLRFTSNLQPVEALFICDLPGNLPTVTGVERALKSFGAGGLLKKVPEDVCQGDAWLQDQFQAGYCQDHAGRKLRVVLHLPRLRRETAPAAQPNLSAFVEKFFPSRDVGLFNDFWQRDFKATTRDGRTVAIPFRDSFAFWEAFNLADRLWDAGFEMFQRLGRDDADINAAKEVWDRIRFADALVAIVAELYRTSDRQSPVLDARVATIGAMHRTLRQRFSDVGADGARATIPKAGGGGTVLDGVLDAAEINRLYALFYPLNDSVTYGGNIEIAPTGPPGTGGTPVIGNGDDRPMDEALSSFLRVQSAAEIVEVDTSWLKVGHVDELFTFVPTTGGGGSWTILQNSTHLGLEILLEALRFYFNKPDLEIDGTDWRNILGSSLGVLGQESDPVFITNVLRGKYWTYQFDHRISAFPLQTPPRMHMESLANRLVVDSTDKHEADEAHMSLLEIMHLEQTFGANRALAAEELFELTSRLYESLNPPSIHFLPAIFDLFEGRATETFLPNMVNMQVIGKHLLVPRPFGPRMRADQAVAVLRKVMGPGHHDDLTIDFIRRHRLEDQDLWIRTQPEVYGLDRILASQLEVAFNLKASLQDANRTHFDANGWLKDGWRNLKIPEKSVDLFELYATVLFNSLGLTVHWIDTWFYHVRHGGLHCGTNTLRRP